MVTCRPCWRWCGSVIPWRNKGGLAGFPARARHEKSIKSVPAVRLRCWLDVGIASRGFYRAAAARVLVNNVFPHPAMIERELLRAHARDHLHAAPAEVARHAA